MRFLLLATDAYGGHGGIALFNRELSLALTQHPACEEVVVIPRLIQKQLDAIPPKVTFVEAAARNNIAYLRALLQARRTKFDVVICGHVNLLPVAFAFGRRPLLITHGIEAWKPLRNPLSRGLLHHCRAVVSVSAFTRDKLQEWSRHRVPTFVLPNAVHLEHYGIRPKRPDLVERYRLEGRRVLLTVGRLVPRDRYKGFEEVLEVLPSLPEDIVYLIAGGGSDGVRLQDLAASLGVADRVRFTGIFEESEKPDLYNLADVYVMPSRGEGFGFVFLEAMACGLPVIGSKLDGGREALLDGELGLLVDPTESEDIRSSILSSLDLHIRRIAPTLEYFSFARFASRVRD
ncbi:MAG TPA: glycosyltransferase, partial [Thermoanaerobaculia bacterium]